MNTPESLTGVALVMNGKAFEIATSDASTGSKWAATSLTTDQQTYFSGNYITSSTTAKADMDGKGNTQRIIDAGVTIATVINDYNTSNGTAGWYLPSLGQLYNIYTNVSQINTLLGMVNGTKIPTSAAYWGSSVYSANAAWLVDFDSGNVRYSSVTSTLRVRLVRDL